jgi:hypothetical protein
MLLRIHNKLALVVARWLVQTGVLVIFACYTPESPALVLGIPPATDVDTNILEIFAAGLARQLDEPVELVRGSNWQQFRTLLETDNIDLVFAAPHLIAWLVEHQAWSPLVRIEDELHFIVVTSQSASDIFEIGDLVGRPVCLPLEPDLGNLVLFSQFPNRNRQPLSREAAGGRDAMESLNDPRCDAVVVIESIYDGAPASLTEPLTLLMKSRALGNYGFATNSESGTERSRLTDALTSSAIHNSVRPLLLQYSGQDKLISHDEREESPGLSDLLNALWD